MSILGNVAKSILNGDMRAVLKALRRLEMQIERVATQPSASSQIAAPTPGGDGDFGNINVNDTIHFDAEKGYIEIRQGTLPNEDRGELEVTSAQHAVSGFSDCIVFKNLDQFDSSIKTTLVRMTKNGEMYRGDTNSAPFTNAGSSYVWLTIQSFVNGIQLIGQNTPNTPSAGFSILYHDSADNITKIIDDSGTVHPLW